MGRRRARRSSATLTLPVSRTARRDGLIENERAEAEPADSFVPTGQRRHNPTGTSTRSSSGQAQGRGRSAPRAAPPTAGGHLRSSDEDRRARRARVSPGGPGRLGGASYRARGSNQPVRRRPHRPAPRGHGRAAPARHGRHGRRRPGPLAQQPWRPEPRRGRRGPACPGGQRRGRGRGREQPGAPRGLCDAAHAGPGRGGRRAPAHGERPGVQGSDAERVDRRPQRRPSRLRRRPASRTLTTGGSATTSTSCSARGASGGTSRPGSSCCG
jgi:hypothetical protein